MPLIGPEIVKRLPAAGAATTLLSSTTGALIVWLPAATAMFALAVPLSRVNVPPASPGAIVKPLLPELKVSPARFGLALSSVIVLPAAELIKAVSPIMPRTPGSGEDRARGRILPIPAAAPGATGRGCPLGLSGIRHTCHAGQSAAGPIHRGRPAGVGRRIQSIARDTAAADYGPGQRRLHGQSVAELIVGHGRELLRRRRIEVRRRRADRDARQRLVHGHVHAAGHGAAERVGDGDLEGVGSGLGKGGGGARRGGRAAGA